MQIARFFSFSSIAKMKPSEKQNEYDKRKRLYRTDIGKNAHRLRNF